MFYQHTPPENPKSRFPVQGKYITFGKLKNTFQFVKLYIANNKKVFHFLCISAHGLIQSNCLSGYTHNPCRLCASGLIRWKLILTHESETLFLYEPIKSETYSLMPCSSSNLGFFLSKYFFLVCYNTCCGILLNGYCYSFYGFFVCKGKAGERRNSDSDLPPAPAAGHDVLRASEPAWYKNQPLSNPAQRNSTKIVNQV